MKAAVGDKVRLKAGGHAGARGIVESLDGDKLVVRLEGAERTVCIAPEQMTNFSLAARKAWRTEPDRPVGRRKGTKLCDRVSVTLRFDRELWERFTAMEEAGEIENRTAIINGWFREKLAELDEKGRQSRCPQK